MNLTKIFRVSFLCLWGFSTYGQSISASVIASSGQYFVSEGFSISSTIGEVVISSSKVSQGFQSPYFVADLVTSVMRKEESDIILYPNTTIGYIYIRSNAHVKPSELQLINPLGQTLLEKKLFNSLEILDVSSFESGVYHIYLIMNDGSSVSRQLLKI